MNKILSKSKLILASPRGFCAGVERAVEILQRAIDLLGAPVYVKHEVVHNKYIIEDFEKKGVMFIEDINSIPDEAVLIYSAHGVSNKIKEIAKKKNLKIFDATCPLVTKVHLQVHKYARQNIDVVLIGHIGHPEIEGTMGRYESEKGKLHLVQFEDDIDSLDIVNPNLAYVTQPTHPRCEGIRPKSHLKPLEWPSTLISTLHRSGVAIHPHLNPPSVWLFEAWVRSSSTLPTK